MLMNQAEMKAELAKSLQAITELLQVVSIEDWQRLQGDKWTIAQESEHLRLSTQGAAFVLSSAGRSRWFPFNGASRSYHTVIKQYQAALAANVNVNNASTRPSDESNTLTLAQQTENWQKVVQQVLTTIDTVSEADLDSFTVWKHPLLGPLTVREMIYFTIHHTQHHHNSLSRKQNVAATA